MTKTMMNGTKSRFLVTTAALLAGVSLASAQGLNGGSTASERGTSAGQSGAGMSQSAPGTSRTDTTQGHRMESRDGRAEGPARERESGRAKRDEGARDRGRAEGPRENGKDQTVGEGRSDRDNAHSQESSKQQREMNKDRASQKKQKDQTVGEGRSDRDKTRRSDDRTSDKDKADRRQVQQPSSESQSKSGMQGQNADDRNSSSRAGQNVTQGETSRTNLTAQQQTTLRQSVLQADNVPRVNVNSLNFQAHAGVLVPSRVSMVSVSTYPVLIDTFPAYRDYNFFVVEDEIVFVDRDRRIVDVVPAGPRTRFSGGGYANSGGVAAIDLPPDDIRVVQRVLMERGLLQGEVDGVWGPATRQAITAFQRQQGIQVTGSIDARTVSSLGVSGRLSEQANEKIGQSQSLTTGQGSGQAGTSQPQPSQRNATGRANGRTTGQAPNQPAHRNQPSTTTGQSSPRMQSGDKPTPHRNAPSGRVEDGDSSPGEPPQSTTPSR